MSSLRRAHANLLCIASVLARVLPKQTLCQILTSYSIKTLQLNWGLYHIASNSQYSSLWSQNHPGRHQTNKQNNSHQNHPVNSLWGQWPKHVQHPARSQARPRPGCQGHPTQHVLQRRGDSRCNQAAIFSLDGQPQSLGLWAKKHLRRLPQPSVAGTKGRACSALRLGQSLDRQCQRRLVGCPRKTQWDVPHSKNQTYLDSQTQRHGGDSLHQGHKAVWLQNSSTMLICA